MQVIPYWDWKYTISFKKDVSDFIIEKLDLLDSSEIQIYKTWISNMKSFVSLHQLLSDLSSESYNTWEETGFLEPQEIINKLLYVPKRIRPIMKALFLSAVKCNPKLEKEISLIYNNSLLKEDKGINFNLIIQNLFGSKFESIQAEMPTGQPHKIEKPKIPNNVLIKDLFLSYYNDAKQSKYVSDYFGKSMVPLDFEVKVDEDIGYGEWWDRDINKTDTDTLIIHNQPDSANLYDIQLTSYHEIYPGHGHFYNVARAIKENCFFDHGAMMLIEGWATYCEWNTSDLGYSKDLKLKAADWLRMSSLNINMEEKAELVYSKRIELGSSSEGALNDIVYLSQYPLYIEQYYWGAFFFEYAFKNIFKSPKEFLEYMKGKNWGDFFDLWG